MDFQENVRGLQAVPSASEYEACATGSFPTRQMALVRAIQETSLSNFAEDLSTRLETEVSAELGIATPLSRTEFLQSVEAGGCVMTLHSEPVRSQALIEFSPGLVAHFLRLLLGAPPSSGNEQRPVTEIELYILREIFELLSRQLSAAWKPAGIAFHWTPTGGEANPWQGTMLVFPCHLSFGDTEESFRVAIPAFLGRLAALQSTPVAPEQASGPVREMILNSLRRAHVNVEAVLAGSTLRMGDLLAIEPGHILMLDLAVGSSAECRIGGKKKFRGEWIGHGNRQALLLL